MRAGLLVIILGISRASASVWPAPRRMKTDVALGSRQIAADFDIRSATPLESVPAAAQRLLSLAADRHRDRVMLGDRAYDDCYAPSGGHPEEAGAAPLQGLSMRVARFDTELRSGVDESYNLTITPGRAEAQLLSATVWGALRGLETFSQLITTRCVSDGAGVPSAPASVSIEDSPAYEHRGVLFDTSRHFLPVSAIKRQIDAMAFSKLNVFHWHIVDSQSFPFEVEEFPEISRAGAYSRSSTYSTLDVRSVVEYGWQRGVRVLPEFDTPGHNMAIGIGLTGPGRNVVVCAEKEPWGSFCAEPPCGQLNIANNFSYRVLDAVLAEASISFGLRGGSNSAEESSTLRSQDSPLSSSSWFHIGGDEVNEACYMSDPGTRAFMAERGMRNLTQLLQYHFDRELDTVERLGMDAIMWEGAWNAGVKLDPRRVAIQTWLPGSLGKIARAGFRVVDSNYDFWYLDCGGGNWVSGGQSWCAPFKNWQMVWSYDPVRNASLSSKEAALVMGGEVAVWGERVSAENVDQKAWPRAAAAAERLWTNPSPDETWQDALPRLVAFRQRLVARGISATPLQPTYCAQGSGPTERCPWPVAPAPAPTPGRKLEQAGITFTNGKYCPNVTFDSPAGMNSLQRLASTGANAVSIIVTQYQKRHNSTVISAIPRPGLIGPRGYYNFTTASDAEVEAAIGAARRLGLWVMLKPQVDLTNDSSAYWRGSIGVQCAQPGASGNWSPRQCERFWDAWFQSYTRMIVRYARLAERAGAQQLSVSCELVNASPQAARWRRVVAAVRKVYSGTLTDSANWGYLNATGGEIYNKTWWDAVDLIGVDAYYPIKGDTVEAMVDSWAPIMESLRALAVRFDRPVAFTEIGYCSANCTRGAPRATQADLAFQANHYESALIAAERGQTQGWFKGLYFWAWNTDPAGSTADTCITPQRKPAERVLRKYFNATEPPLPPPKEPPVCLCTV